MLFITVLEVISRKLRSGCPDELLHNHDLALDSESLESLQGKLETWKRALKFKELGENVKKMEITIISGLRK